MLSRVHSKLSHILLLRDCALNYSSLRGTKQSPTFNQVHVLAGDCFAKLRKARNDEDMRQLYITHRAASDIQAIANWISSSLIFSCLIFLWMFFTSFFLILSRYSAGIIGLYDCFFTSMFHIILDSLLAVAIMALLLSLLRCILVKK